MEFRTLTRKFLGEEPGGQGQLFGDSSEPMAPEIDTLNSEKTSYRLAVTKDEIQQEVDQLKSAKAVCFDTETDGVDPISANIVGISLSAEKGSACYIPMNVEDALTEAEVIDLLRPIFESESILKIAHNLKFDLMILEQTGITVTGPFFDTMVAAYLIDSSQRLKMDTLAKEYLNYQPIPIEDLIGKGKPQITMADLSYKEIKDYAAEDADITFQLYKLFSEKLKNDALLEIAEKLEFPLIPVLVKMEGYGVHIDKEMLESFSEELTTDLDELEKKIFELTEEEFNLNSPQQLGSVLFDKMKLPAGKKTKTGQYSTSEDVLSKLALEYEVPSLILDYRSLSKLRSTYVDALPKIIHPKTNRIHTDFNQTVTATGRLSSSNPNLQNIPIRTARGREIRKAFIPMDGFKLLAADYSQVELRVIASISGDENMIQSFKNGEDIHSRTAKEIFNLDSLDEVTPTHRRKAKEVNFGIPYGVSAYGLASRLGISNTEGKEMIDQYFDRFPGIKKYIDDTVLFAKENGYVTTLMGRRRYIPEINSGNWNVRGFAERTAINMPIQGTAADIIKLAMIDIHSYLQSEGLESRMLLQVHDELIFEIEGSEVDFVPDKIKGLMESAFKLDVPLDVDMGLADNWLEAH
jgi:DNA polymerase-1